MPGRVEVRGCLFSLPLSVCARACVYACECEEKVTSCARFSGTALVDCARGAKHQHPPKDNKVLIQEKKRRQ